MLGVEGHHVLKIMGTAAGRGTPVRSSEFRALKMGEDLHPIPDTEARPSVRWIGGDGERRGRGTMSDKI